MSSLPQQLLTVHRALAAKRIPHAFGGAIALAYATQDPRGTSDIDVNLFVPAQRCGRALAALPDGVELPDDIEDVIARDGQARLWWDGTPIDVFFDYAPIHAAAREHRRVVPFEGARIPVLGPQELAAFKVMFDRTRDWADIEAMIAAGSLDVEQLRRTVSGMLGADDPRVARIDDAVSRGT